MRVLILTADYAPGSWSGIGVAVARQAKTMAALGAEVLVLGAGAGRAARHSWRDRPGLTVRPLPADAFPVEPGAFDWVHVHSLCLTGLALELRRRYGVKLAYTVHTQPWRELQGSPRAEFWRQAQSALLSASDHVVFLSEAERELARQSFDGQPRRSSVLPNGVPRAPVIETDWNEEGPLVFAGRFAESKGLLVLETCLARFADGPPRPVVIAGGHGDERGAQAVTRIQHGLGVRCRVAGWLSRRKLDRLFGRASLVVAPSLYEPCGLVALEAMRMGAPLLASGVGGLAEIVRQGSGGRIVPSFDAGAWADGVAELLSDTTACRRLHRQGPRYVDRHYGSKVLAKKLLAEVYDW